MISNYVVAMVRGVSFRIVFQALCHLLLQINYGMFNGDSTIASWILEPFFPDPFFWKRFYTYFDIFFLFLSILL